MATITKRGDTYRIRASFGYNLQGKQIIRSMTYKPKPGMTQKQIEKELQRQAVLFEESSKEDAVRASSIKLEEFMRQWFNDYADLKLKKITICSYHNMEGRIYSNLGHLHIDQLEPMDIQRFVSKMVDENLSADTIKNHIRLVSNVLNYGIKKRVLKYNPCTTVDYPRAIKRVKTIYTVEEAKQFLELLHQEDEKKMPYIAFFTLLAYTGARKCEILALHWQDIDFDKSTLSINKGYSYSAYHKESYIDTTKTLSSVRVIKLSTVPIEMLKKLQIWQSYLIESERLFVDIKNKPMSPWSPNRFLKRFCHRHGLKEVTPHSFRHFAASSMINNCVDVVSVQVVLGHSQPSTTLNLYSQAFKNANSKAANAIATALE